jgi:hypothetical protein
MPLIEREESAMRLANAIANDLKLYNSDRLARAADPWNELAQELAEGRKLYESRVVPEHHALFDMALVEAIPELGRGALSPRPLSERGEPPSSIPQGFFSDAPPQPERGGSGLVLLIGMAVVGILITWWFVFR